VCPLGESDVNKDGLSKAIYEVHGGISFADARRIVDLILDLIKGRLIKGEKVLVSGFGSFRIVKRRDRMGINPQTGETILIRGRRAISFKPSKNLKSL
jgi:nucleoid DNA-binding protein